MPYARIKDPASTAGAHLLGLFAETPLTVISVPMLFTISAGMHTHHASPC
jgi:hypothetical protein